MAYGGSELVTLFVAIVALCAISLLPLRTRRRRSLSNLPSCHCCASVHRLRGAHPDKVSASQHSRRPAVDLLSPYRHFCEDLVCAAAFRRGDRICARASQSCDRPCWHSALFIPDRFPRGDHLQAPCPAGIAVGAESHGSRSCADRSDHRLHRPRAGSCVYHRRRDFSYL